MFQTSQGSARRSPPEPPAQGRPGGSAAPAQGAHAVARPMIGTICEVCQNASPSASPSAPARTASDRFFAPSATGRISAPSSVSLASKPGVREERHERGGTPGTGARPPSAAGSPIVRRPTRPEKQRRDHRVEDRDHTDRRACSAPVSRQIGAPRTMPGSRVDAPQLNIRNCRRGHATSSAPVSASSEFMSPSVERYTTTRRTRPQIATRPIRMRQRTPSRPLFLPTLWPHPPCRIWMLDSVR